MKPQLIDGCGTLVFELVRPFAAVLVLGIFPFGADALFEKMVIGFEGQFGGRSDVVLEIVSRVTQSIFEQRMYS